VSTTRLIVTGSSGFVGRHLLARLVDRYEIVGIARRTQLRSGAPVHPRITWFQADIGEHPQVEAVFARIAAMGGADAVVHLAAHYDFTGEEDPEYWRTNVDGLRYVLDLSVRHGIRTFIFSSSTAACGFPPPGGALTEASVPDGSHIYARTKAAGEALVRQYGDRLKAIVVRFAALFSDWCEYPPLYFFLRTWLSHAWNSRILGGRGRSAIPYLHVSDAVLFLMRVLEQQEALDHGEVLVASPDGAVSHRELFEAATLAWSGTRGRPMLMPRALCRPGIRVMDLLGRLQGERPFERPWMADYVDLSMTIDAHRTRRRIDWAPRPRLLILRRLPFLIENLKTDPVEWHRRNREALKRVEVPVNLKLHWLLEVHEAEIIRAFNDLITGPLGATRFRSYQRLSPGEHEWNHRLVLQQLRNAVRTRERGIFMAYCRELAARRHAQGYRADELCDALEALNLVCFRVLRRDPETRGMRQAIQDYVTSTLRSGCDQAQEVFELAGEGPRDPVDSPR
jgi:nucleoside-diphosphate-sugar epimerase